jgi:hypothetical protein
MVARCQPTLHSLTLRLRTGANSLIDFDENEFIFNFTDNGGTIKGM